MLKTSSDETGKCLCNLRIASLGRAFLNRRAIEVLVSEREKEEEKEKDASKSATNIATRVVLFFSKLAKSFRPQLQSIGGESSTVKYYQSMKLLYE